MNEVITKTFRTGCVLCGKDIEYFDTQKELSCQLCGNTFLADCACTDGHYICNACHSKKGFEIITEYALSTDLKNPIKIAESMMKNGFINMHGPEHHYLVPSALLAAYKNCGGDIQLEKLLKKALDRAKNVPGGICGMWGSCGAGIGTGIFISVLTGANSLSQREWGMSNEMTSRSLLLISKNGGPRCCKRNTYLAINQAIEFVEENFNIQMEKTENIRCVFFPMNKTCKGTDCLYWPKKQ